MIIHRQRHFFNPVNYDFNIAKVGFYQKEYKCIRDGKSICGGYYASNLDILMTENPDDVTCKNCLKMLKKKGYVR